MKELVLVVESINKHKCDLNDLRPLPAPPREQTAAS